MIILSAVPAPQPLTADRQIDPSSNSIDLDCIMPGHVEPYPLYGVALEYLIHIKKQVSHLK